MNLRLLRSRLAFNALSLYTVQGLQYLIPLITLPWMVRALGTGGYGWLSIVGAFGGYFQVLCDYGFQLSAPRSVALANEHRKPVSEVAMSVIGAKLVLLSAGGTVLTLFAFLSPSYQAHASWFALGAAGAIASSFFPSWLFQGMEKMGAMALLSSVSRLIQLALVLLLIRSPDHVGRALWITSSLSVLTTAAAWVLAARQFDLEIRIPSPSSVWSTLREGFEIFLSQAGGLLFANTNVMMLASLASPQAVGFYSIAEKIVRVGIQVGGPIGTVLYPRIAVLAARSRAEAFGFLRRVLVLGSAGFLGLCIALVIASPFAIRFVCGHPSPEILPLVWILSPLPLTVFIDNILGTQVLLNCGFRREFMLVSLSAGLAAIGFQALFIPSLGAKGAALSLLLAELFILVAFAVLARRLTGFPSLPSAKHHP